MDPSISPNIVPEIWPLVLKTGGALIIIIGILVAILFVAKRFTSLPGRQEEIKIIGARHFSPREKLVIVEVFGKKILLGVTPGRIEKIEVFETPEKYSKADDKTFRKELEVRMEAEKKGGGPD